MGSPLAYELRRTLAFNMVAYGFVGVFATLTDLNIAFARV